MDSLSSSELATAASIGLGFTPSEWIAVQQRIDAAATAAADHAADAAQRRAGEKIGAAETATKKTVYIGLAVASIGGGLLGAVAGYLLARRR